MIMMMWEKQEYIKQDFEKRFAIYRKFPETQTAKERYIQRFRADALDWCKRYEGRPQWQYAVELLDDLLRSIEKIVGGIK